MNKKIMILIFNILIITIILVGCSSSGKKVFLGSEKGYTRINEESSLQSKKNNIKTLDWVVNLKNIESVSPILAKTYEEKTIVNNIFVGLTKQVGVKVIPSLAEKIIISNSKLEYTFVLRDAYWSNGEKISAYDFVSSWDKLEKLTSKSNKTSIFKILGISEYKVLSNRTLFVRLNRKNEDLLKFFSSSIFFPYKNDFEYKGDFSNDLDVISSGPYKLSIKRNENKVTLIQNEYYKKDIDINYDKINILNLDKKEKINREEEVVISSTYNLLDNKNELLKNTNYRYLPFNQIKTLFINSKSDVLKNKYERFKINKVLDRMAILDYSNENMGLITNDFVDGSLNYAKLGYIENYIMNLTTKNLKGKNIKFIYYNNETNEKIANIIKLIFETNFDAKIVSIGYSKINLKRAINNKDFDILLGEVNGVGNSKDSYLISLYPNSYEEYTNWGSRSYVKYLDEYMLDRNSKILTNAYIELYTSSYHIPLFYTGFSIIKDDRINLNNSCNNNFIDFTRINNR